MKSPKNPIASMKTSRLQEILENAQQGTATINEAVEIAGAALASSSRNSGEIKQMIQEIAKSLKAMQAQIDFLYQNNSPIYAAILEEDEENESSEDASSSDDSDDDDDTAVDDDENQD